MKIGKHAAAAVLAMRDDLTPDVRETADRFKQHLNAVAVREGGAIYPVNSVSAQRTVEAAAEKSQSNDSPAIVKNPFVLKKLSQKHKDMVVLSLQGLSRDKVAEYCGCTPEYVTMINRQPLAKAYIADLESHLDLRLRGLYEKSINAIQDGLTSPRVSDKLAAASLHLETIGKRQPVADDSRESAEDVVSAMLISNSNVQVNIKK